jgi:hypothetical protein
VRSYLRQMVPCLARYGRALAAIGQLAADPRPGDPTWRERLAGEVRAGQAGQREISQVAGIPSTMREAHAGILEASRQLGEAAECLLAAEGQDTASLEQAAALVLGSTEELRQASEAIAARLARLG